MASIHPQGVIMFIISKVMAHKFAYVRNGKTIKKMDVSKIKNCDRTDVEDKKYKAICMTCNCAFEFINLFKVTKEKEKEAKRKRKVEPN